MTRLPVRARRIIMGLCIAAGLAALAIEAAGVSGAHRTVLAVAAPLVAIVSGVLYLWSTRGRP